VRRADVIAITVVLDCSAPRWNTPSGQKPAAPGSHIYRVIRLRVEQGFKGTTPGQVYSVIAGGGTLDDVTQVIEPRPRYLSGQRSLVLLSNAGTTVDGAPLWLVQERDTIDPSGVAIDEFYPSRRWPVAERVAQLQTAMAAVP
jgi:hypothetical protein